MKSLIDKAIEGVPIERTEAARQACTWAFEDSATRGVNGENDCIGHGNQTGFGAEADYWEYNGPSLKLSRVLFIGNALPAVTGLIDGEYAGEHLGGGK